jgi:hypothetical protein
MHRPGVSRMNCRLAATRKLAESGQIRTFETCRRPRLQPARHCCSIQHVLPMSRGIATPKTAARQLQRKCCGGRARRDDDLHVERHGHDPRHGERYTARRRVVALSAGLLVCETRLEDRLIFGRERRLLGAAQRLRLIPLIADPGRLARHAREVRIQAFVKDAKRRSRAKALRTAPPPRRLVLRCPWDRGRPALAARHERTGGTPAVPGWLSLHIVERTIPR